MCTESVNYCILRRGRDTPHIWYIFGLVILLFPSRPPDATRNTINEALLLCTHLKSTVLRNEPTSRLLELELTPIDKPRTFLGQVLWNFEAPHFPGRIAQPPPERTPANFYIILCRRPLLLVLA